MLTIKWFRYLKDRLTRSLGTGKNIEKDPDTICPMQQTHPSDEPDQGTKGTEGPDTHASVWKNSRTLTAQGNNRCTNFLYLPYKSASMKRLSMKDLH